MSTDHLLESSPPPTLEGLGDVASLFETALPPPAEVRRALIAELDPVLRGLYARLSRVREFAALLAAPGETERLAGAQQVYWRALLESPWASERADTVRRIAEVHWRLGIAPEAMLLAYDFVGRRLLARLRTEAETARSTAAWLWSVIHHDLSLALAALERLHRAESEQVQAELERLALSDPLTGLANRRLFVDRLERALFRQMREGGTVGLLRLDLDRFKHVNDTWGHEAGDLVLTTVAERLTGALRASDLAARIGGDEFAVLIEGNVTPGSLLSLAERLVAELSRPLRTAAGTIPLGLSIGAALAPAHASEAHRLLRAADEALYAAKGRGGCGVEMAGVHGADGLGRDWFDAFLRACDDGSLHFLFQPQVALDDRRLRGFEALLRWHYRGQDLTPDRFLPHLTHPVLARRLTEWSLEQACTFANRLGDDPNVTVAVNLSRPQLRLADLPELVEAPLARHRLPPARLELEITEDVLLDAEDGTAARHVAALAELGVRIALDDFGTGWASLSHLERFPVHTLKIDRGFVATLHRSARAAGIVRTLCHLARVIGADVVAEGVESPEQAERLRGYRCRYAQGWLYACPLPADAALAFAAGTAGGEEASPVVRSDRHVPAGAPACDPLCGAR